MSILSIRCYRRQETVSVPRCSLKKQTWTIIFRIQLMRRHISGFLKKRKQRDTALQLQQTSSICYHTQCTLSDLYWSRAHGDHVTSVTIPEAIQHWITRRPNKFSLLFLICRYRERANTSMSIIDIGILTGFKPDQESLKVEFNCFLAKIKGSNVIHFGDFDRCLFMRSQNWFPCCYNWHHHWNWSESFSSSHVTVVFPRKGRDWKGRKKRVHHQKFSGEDGTGAREIYSHTRAT